LNLPVISKQQNVSIKIFCVDLILSATNFAFESRQSKDFYMKMQLPDFINAVERLASLHLDHQQEIQDLITYFYGDKGTIMLPCDNKFVVRASLNNDNKIFTNVQRCSYPPDYKRISLQRCNYRGQQVFYCSMYSDTDFTDTSLTCLIETAKETLDNNIDRKYITLSRWELVRPLNLWVLPFCDVSCNKNRDFKKYRDEAIDEINQYKNSQEVIKSLEYMSNVFCQSRNKNLYYKISSAYFNSLLLYEKINGFFCDGLAYPSANTEGAGINVVLKKEVIVSKIIYCSSATMYLMERNHSRWNDISWFPASDTAFVKQDGNFSFYSTNTKN
jgi:hypothetical protein